MVAIPKLHDSCIPNLRVGPATQRVNGLLILIDIVLGWGGLGVMMLEWNNSIDPGFVSLWVYEQQKSNNLSGAVTTQETICQHWCRLRPGQRNPWQELFRLRGIPNFRRTAAQLSVPKASGVQHRSASHWKTYAELWHVWYCSMLMYVVVALASSTFVPFLWFSSIWPCPCSPMQVTRHWQPACHL